MLAWVVIYRRHLRQSPQSRFIRALPLPASPLNLQLLAFNLPLFLPFRFYSSTFNRFLINVPFPKFFPCHTSENSPVSLGIATDPKTPLSKSCICHTSETPPGPVSQHANTSNIQTIPQSIPFLFKFFRTLLLSFALFRTLQKLNWFIFMRFRTLCKKPPGVGVAIATSNGIGSAAATIDGQGFSPFSTFNCRLSTSRESQFPTSSILWLAL